MAADFIPLGELPGGDVSSRSYDVSDDGAVVVGSSQVWDTDTNQGSREAFRWTVATGMVGLGDLPGGFFISSANGVSSDGSVVVGTGGIEGPRSEAFRWTSTDGMVGLGAIHNTIVSSQASAVSADGNVVVGTSIAPGAPPGQGSNHQEAFRWNPANGMVGLGDLEGGNFTSNAYDVSADGSVVVGLSYGASSFQAFRWTEAGGMVGLGAIHNTTVSSQARAVSADGNVVVGYGSSEAGLEAFRWTDVSGMVGLGDLPGGGFESQAVDVSADGSVVVGNSQTDTNDNEFFVWTQANGMQRLQEILEAEGTTGLSGWSQLSAGAISDNGQWVVGQGTNPLGFTEAFLTQLPASISGPLRINPGLNDAWYNPETNGQGFFITVFPDLGAVSLAWFTYDTELPPLDATANLGDPGHRWLTAVGPIDGNQALMNIEMTSGGIFDTPSVITSTDPPGSDGTILLTFDSCNSGTIEYNIPSINRQGTVPIQRVAADNIALCEALKAD